jgi:hypothetical protein
VHPRAGRGSRKTTRLREMAGPTKPLCSLQRPSQPSPGWRGGTGLACSSVCSRWRRWKPRNASGCAASAIYRNAAVGVQANIRRRRFGFGLGRTSVSPSPSQQSTVEGPEFELSNRPALGAVDEQGRESDGLAGKFLAPLSQRDQRREHPAPFRRQQEFLIGAAVGGWRCRQGATVDQRARPHGEDILRASEIFLKFAEAADAKRG